MPLPRAYTPVDPRIAKVISELEKTRLIHQAALSPDGQTIAWVTDAAAGTEITIASTADPSRSHRLTAGTGAPCTEESLAWSPDSKALAFTSDCNSPAGATDQADVYLAAPNAASTAARRLTHLHGGITSLAFSPDGLHIACLYIEGATRPAGALAPMKPPAGVIGVEGLEIQRIATVETASGEFRQVTPATLHVYEYDWAPDSRQLAYTAAPPPGKTTGGSRSSTPSRLTDGQPKLFSTRNTPPGPLHGLQIAVPRWSPAGRPDRLYRRPDERPGRYRRRYLFDTRQRGRAEEYHPERRQDRGLDSLAQRRVIRSCWSPGSNPDRWRSAKWTQRDGKVIASYETIPASVGDGRLEQSLSVAADGTVAYHHELLCRSSRGLRSASWGRRHNR